MKIQCMRMLPPVFLAGALLAGCGGGGSDAAQAPPPPDISQSVSALVDYINGLIAGTSEASEPIDIAPLTLAVDDTAEPTPL